MTTFYPSLRYRDAPAAIEWLEGAFGFTTAERYRNDDGTVAHAELAYGDGRVMLGSTKEDDFGDHAGQGWCYVATDDTDALHDRATQAGAEIVRPLSDTDYGSSDFSCRDPEGNLWSFGTYRP